MAVIEAQALDMSAILMQAYDLGDLIKDSAETADYLYWKQRKEEDPQVHDLLKQFQKKKDLFEECQRFGHFHPDYHSALDQAKSIQDQLDNIEAVRRFKEAEQRLDNLLFTVSETIARSVSDSIKVPSNDPLASGGAVLLAAALPEAPAQAAADNSQLISVGGPIGPSNLFWFLRTCLAP